MCLPYLSPKNICNHNTNIGSFSGLQVNYLSIDVIKYRTKTRKYHTVGTVPKFN